MIKACSLQNLVIGWLLLCQPLPAADAVPASEEFPGSAQDAVANASWGRGYRVFYHAAGCANCHVIRGKGGTGGPDLSFETPPSADQLLQSILHPQQAITPGFATMELRLADGTTVQGTVRQSGEELQITTPQQNSRRIAVSQIQQQTTIPGSIMPGDYQERLSKQQLADLVAFLSTPAPAMPRDAKLPRPPARTHAELAAILAGSERLNVTELPPLHLLLVGGKKDHGPGEHDYPAWVRTWQQLLLAAPGVTVETALEWPGEDQIQRADVIVFYQKGAWTPERATAIDAHLARGKGLAYIHWAVNGNAAAPEFAQRIGLASTAGGIRYRHGPLDLDFGPGRGHPIARNFSAVHFHDESYWMLSGDPNRLGLLATAVEEGEPRPQFWTYEPRAGRVFVSIPGHYSWTFDDPLYRVLLLRGIAWAADQPVDRFNEIVPLGADLSD